MLKELDIRLESLNYTAHFARPPFDLWGKGREIIAPLYEALSPYGVTLGNIVINAGAASAADPVVTVVLQGNSTVKFAFDRLEFAFNNSSQEFFESIPKLLKDCSSWLKRELPGFKFASHNFAYFCHALVKDSTAKNVLDTVNPKLLKSAGLSMGNGSIFHNSVTDKNWTTRIWFDYSQSVPGALFLALFIDTVTEELDYETTMVDARTYFRSVLAEVNLTLPELSK